MSNQIVRPADVTFEMPCGTVHLVRAKKHQRVVEIRRKGSFGWTLGPDNLLIHELEERLRTDLAGSVALQLLGRASLTWDIAPNVKVLHEPDDVEELQRTPDLEAAAEQIAAALRAEIDADAIVDEARERLEGPVLWRSAYAVHLGRRTKTAPHQSERCFGRLAPLGVSNLQTVIPWLGYVRARALTDWPHFHFMGTSTREATELSLQHPHVDLWLQPEYGAASKAVETLAVTDGLRAATRSSDSAARITLTCDDVITCRPLRTLFAPRLRLVVPDGPDRSIARPLPLEDPRELEEVLKGIGLPEMAGELARGWWVLVPFTPSTFLRRLPESEALLHAMLWIAQEEPDFALDPWAYTDLKERGMPTWAEIIRSYELDADEFAAAIAEVRADVLPDIWADDEAPTLAASCRRAVSLLRHDLEPALRDYEDGELTSLLEVATGLREKLEAVTRALLSGQYEAADGDPQKYPTRQRP